jgi:hypothetical protein
MNRSSLFAGLIVTLAAGSSTGAERVESTLFLLVGEDRVIAAPDSAPNPVLWFALEAIAGDYNNPKYCGRPATHTCHAPIRYRRRLLPTLRGRRSFHITEIQELGAPGTHRIVAGDETTTEAEVGEDAIAGATVIAVRESNAYLGYLTELLGVPFVYWPEVIPDIGHQTEAQLGADCVAVVVYGRRRMGCPTPYVAPAGLFKLAKPVPATKQGKPRVEAGDILHFGFQTAVLAQDNPPIGELDDGDLVIHAYHGLVERVPFGALPYRIFSHTILRWPASCSASPAPD